MSAGVDEDVGGKDKAKRTPDDALREGDLLLRVLFRQLKQKPHPIKHHDELTDLLKDQPRPVSMIFKRGKGPLLKLTGLQGLPAGMKGGAPSTPRPEITHASMARPVIGAGKRKPRTTAKHVPPAASSSQPGEL